MRNYIKKKEKGGNKSKVNKHTDVGHVILPTEEVMHRSAGV